MEAVSLATPPALASAIRGWFPELNGRSIAVSEIDPISKTNMPKLPICFVALMKEVGNGSGSGSNAKATPEELLMVSFVFEPERYQREDGGESPFWAFFDYDSLRDRLLTFLLGWKTPRGARLNYFGLDVESDSFAILINFQFKHNFTWCPIEEGDPGIKDWSFKVNVCPAQPLPCLEPVIPDEEEDPCP